MIFLAKYHCGASTMTMRLISFLTLLSIFLFSGHAKAEDYNTESSGWKVSGFDGSTNATSATLIWRTEVPTTAVLHIGLSATDLSNQSVDVPASKTSHLVTVPNLPSATRFYFQVVATDQDGAVQVSEIISKKTKAP
jgi:hypothetical protein